MATTTHGVHGLAYDVNGQGVPIVFLHGLTFDRRNWRPIIERLGGSVMTIAIDLPAHGDSGGTPGPLDAVAAQTHDLVGTLTSDRPIVVGHSMSGGIAGMYAAAYPALGVVMVDNGPDIQPFAELVHRMAPALRGPGFADMWRMLEDSLGLDRVPEPTRAAVIAGQRVDQDVVLGYWDMLLRTDPSEVQAWVDAQLTNISAPCLAVFGRPLTPGERDRFNRLPDVAIEEWVDGGHFVHLVEPDRFALRLREFVEHCAAP